MLIKVLVATWAWDLDLVLGACGLGLEIDLCFVGGLAEGFWGFRV